MKTYTIKADRGIALVVSQSLYLLFDDSLDAVGHPLRPTINPLVAAGKTISSNVNPNMNKCDTYNI